MTINGRREAISQDDLVSVCKRAGLSARAARRIIDQVQQAVNLFSDLANEHGLPESLSRETAAGLAMVRRRFDR